MKTSLRKLRGFGLNKHEVKERRDIRPLAQLDELAQAALVRFLLLSCVFFFFCCPENEKEKERKRGHESRKSEPCRVNSLAFFSFFLWFLSSQTC
jgi:anion-transporting  ArsA/GET3 family ATPase